MLGGLNGRQSRVHDLGASFQLVDSRACGLDGVTSFYPDRVGAHVHVIAIAARKGGVGKTTLAMHLSVLASAPGRPALLLDTDPQRSLAWWHRLRKEDEPNLIEADARELPDIIEAARREGFGRVIIDTPPHAEDSILNAMRVADLVVVPTRPGPLDLAAVATTLELAHRIGKAPLAVLNHCPPRTGAAEPAIVTEARAALSNMGAAVAATAVANRVSMSHAILTGSTVNEHEPGGKAAGEVEALWREIEAALPRETETR
ncbi:ParA family protein [Methylobacterium indicum]|uniref:ParA family protein n=1 Tax=Methylobacterium indicum TaxID=1775910 RepID=UPI001FD5B163|nr:ParA family protein [Methylobacterium indicum]